LVTFGCGGDDDAWKADGAAVERKENED